MVGTTISRDDEIISAKRQKAKNVLDRLLIDTNQRQSRKQQIQMIKEEEMDRPLPGPREGFNTINNGRLSQRDGKGNITNRSFTSAQAISPR
jgi:hypothetical protein